MYKIVYAWQKCSVLLKMKVYFDFLSIILITHKWSENRRPVAIVMGGLLIELTQPLNTEAHTIDHRKTNSVL